MRLALALLVAGCVHDRYVCATDPDCDLGSGGRCERDGRCTELDANCATGRRYSDHAAGAGACFAVGVAPLDPFVAGQTPAVPDGCFAQVCDALPACCASGWTEPCVQLAEIACDEPHDTRLAITATRAGEPAQLWDLRWTGTRWYALERPDLATAIGWIAPAPGGTAPRFYGGTKAGGLQIDGADPVAMTTVLDSVTSVDFDLSGRDQIAIGSHPTGLGTGDLELVDLDRGTRTALSTDTAFAHAAWGAVDADPYPDVVASTGGTYVVLANVAAGAARDLRSIANSGESAADIGATLRSVAWADLDGDRALDLVAFGGALRLHFDPVTGIPDRNLDCNPLVDTAVGAPACTAAARNATGFVGAASPGQLVVAVTPDTGTPEVETPGPVYRIATTRTGFAAPIAMMAPTCVGPCYAPIRALALRDLDGDHVLDVIAIDANLAVLYSLSTVDPDRLILDTPIPAPVNPQPQIAISVAGALTP